MQYLRALVYVLFLSALWIGGLSIVRGTTDNLPPCEFPAIYSFGDSTADTGGLAAAFDQIPDLDRKKFIHSPQFVGRGSEARLIIDFIAEHLELPPLSPYLDSLGANFRRGANFAVGGSTIRRPKQTCFGLMSPFPLDVQILQFHRFKARSIQLFNQAKTASEREKLPRPEDFVKALYTFDIGQNDIFFGLKAMSADQLVAEIPDMINQLASAIQNLYQEGGRTFWIHNTIPLGCMPMSVLSNPNPSPENIDDHGCVKDQNDISIEFNRQLKERAIQLRAELPEAAITYVDIYTAKYALTVNAQNLGYVDPFKFWYRHGQHNEFEWCGENSEVYYSPSCENPLKYVTWDGGHHSHAANQWVASHILNGSLSDPPVPISQACHRQPSSIIDTGVFLPNMFKPEPEPEACSQFL